MKTETKSRAYTEGTQSRRRNYQCRQCKTSFQVDTVGPLPEKDRVCSKCVANKIEPTKHNTKYDILSRARRKGQGVLLELPRVGMQERESVKEKVRTLAIKEHRAMIRSDGEIYDYAFKHPELCPPVGTVMYIRNRYGVKAKVTVRLVFRGLPGTTTEVLPASKQPEHLRGKDFLAAQTAELGRPNWVGWTDVHAWRMWQELDPKPEPQLGIEDLWPAPDKHLLKRLPELSQMESILSLYPEMVGANN